MSDRFISHMLTRNIRIEEDLIDQLFNSSEKRLARTLLLLARYGKPHKPIRMVPKISQETLAEMVDTTLARSTSPIHGISMGTGECSSTSCERRPARLMSRDQPRPGSARSRLPGRYFTDAETCSSTGRRGLVASNNSIASARCSAVM